MIDEVMMVLEGRHGRLLEQMKMRMEEAAQDLCFEECSQTAGSDPSLGSGCGEAENRLLDNIDQILSAMPGWRTWRVRPGVLRCAVAKSLAMSTSSQMLLSKKPEVRS